MQTVLIVVHLLIVVALIAVVLLQRSEGGALGMGGGSGGFFTGRGQANALTRATAILATLFFMTSLGLTILASYTHASKSIFESPAAGPASTSDQSKGADQPKGTVLDQLKQLEKTAPPAPEPVPAPPRSQ
ncbi:preprotein translocase subunit SecG [Rhodoblastus sp.]|jgi:preprotein translocase subunit SecG|uniref:preprotein translocase subunit SecG n=1 Tax=Rhodoblastus sp. TaxID=1962975 RepID=UPI0025E266E2|nr:preprotein translocase subunit SecG [Rhodoblastus sp.]